MQWNFVSQRPARGRPAGVWPRLFLLTPAALALVACANTPSHSPARLPAAANTPAQASAPESAPQPDPAKFAAFLAAFRAEAIKAGIRPAIYDRSMAGLTPNAHIVELDNKQPEFVRPVWDYLDGAVSPLRVKTGLERIAANATALANIESRYGVPKEILAAIWGIESDYGASMGRYNMFQSLATLAYDGRRMALGHSELLAALRMEQREDYAPDEMTSSWAGAFGQTQFMPSTFLAHAVDGDGDGRIDLWHSPADALASTASMLAEDGWQSGAPWLEEVRLPADFPYDQAEFDNPQSLPHWRGLGVTDAFGNRLKDDGEAAAILLPAGAKGPAFLVFPNFRVILKYNNATSYALAVSELALRFDGGPGVVHSWPRDEMPLNRDEAFALQRGLKTLGYDPGNIDGLIGAHVKRAVRAYQSDRHLVPDGFVTEKLLRRIERDIAAKSP